MSSQKYASPLRFKIVPSRLLIAIVTVMHLGAIGLLLPASLPLWTIVVSCLAITVSLLVSWSRAGWITRQLSLSSIWPNFAEAVWDEADHWQLIDEHQQIYPAKLMPSTYVSAQLVVINLRLDNIPWYCRFRAIVLLPDNIDSESFRRLRIRLRWYSSQVQDSLVASK
ncbi:protein YgfX [Kaarinaea lacus]